MIQGNNFVVKWHGAEICAIDEASHVFWRRTFWKFRLKCLAFNKRILLRDHEEGDTLSLQIVGSNPAMHSSISAVRLWEHSARSTRTSRWSWWHVSYSANVKQRREDFVSRPKCKTFEWFMTGLELFVVIRLHQWSLLVVYVYLSYSSVDDSHPSTDVLMLIAHLSIIATCFGTFPNNIRDHTVIVVKLM